MENLVFEPSQTTHWKNLFPNKTMLLGSHNLNPGEELVAIITEVALSEIKDPNTGKNESVPVVRFENAPPMVMNVTNARSIACLYGDLSEAWVGCPVQIYAATVKAFGKETMALRIREAIPDTEVDIQKYEKALRAAKTLNQLKDVFMKIPKHLKPKMTPTKDEMKEQLNAKG